jgi:PAS domain S-box-containing protein
MSETKVVTLLNSEEAEILRLNRQVLEESTDLIAIIGSDYNYYYVNPAYVRIHSKTQEDFIGHNVKEFLGEDVFENIVKPNLDRCLKGEKVRYEDWFDFGGSGIMYMAVEYIRLPNNEGVADRIVIISRNITSEKEWEEAKDNQEKFKTVVEAVETQNYEINNSLCSVSGYLEILLTGEKDLQKIHCLEKSIKELQRLGQITHAIDQMIARHSKNFTGSSQLNIHHDCKGTA